MHVNLLPAPFVLGRLIRKRIRQWGCAFGTLGVFALALNIHLVGKCLSGLREFQEIRAAVEPIRQLQADRIQQAKQSIAIKQKTNQLRATVSEDRTNSLLGIVANGVLSTEGSVQIQEMQVLVSAKATASTVPTRAGHGSTSSKDSSEAQNIATRNEYQMTLRGIATESESITTFMESLQKSNVFPRVELRSTQERTIAERSVQEFQLECLSYE